MSLLSKAKDKAKAGITQAKPKRNTTWTAGDPNGDRVAASLKELAQINADLKALEAKKKIHAGIVGSYAEQNFINDFCELGVLPDTPMKVVDNEGNSVTYVVQDRGGQYKLQEVQIQVLKEVLGEDAAESLLYTQHTFSFSRSIMAIPGVADAVDKALTATVRKLVKDEVLTEEAGDELLVVDEKIAFKPGTLDRAASLVGRDKTRLKAFLDAMGSSCCRYIK